MIYSLQFKKAGDVFEASTSVAEDAAGKEETRIVSIEVKNEDKGPNNKIPDIQILPSTSQQQEFSI